MAYSVQNSVRKEEMTARQLFQKKKVGKKLVPVLCGHNGNGPKKDWI